MFVGKSHKALGKSRSAKIVSFQKFSKVFQSKKQTSLEKRKEERRGGGELPGRGHYSCPQERQLAKEAYSFTFSFSSSSSLDQISLVCFENFWTLTTFAERLLPGDFCQATSDFCRATFAKWLLPTDFCRCNNNLGRQLVCRFCLVEQITWCKIIMTWYTIFPMKCLGLLPVEMKKKLKCSIQFQSRPPRTAK